jgi:endoglucanase
MGNRFFLIPILAFLINFLQVVNAQGYLHRQDKKVVNGSGQEILLKGLGLGGWLLQEGYMLQTSSFANAQWQLREKIIDLIGEANTELFYEKYRENFIKKVDIDSIKSWGFNSIRLPFHYNLFSNPPQFTDKGFKIIDSLLSWCETNQIYLILDMHAAPGGQSDENISDYNPSYPSLWQSELNKDLTVQIWRKIAERYSDKQWIGGYDLLNEPKWDLPPNNQPLRDLFIRLTDTIRTVDTNHIVFIEGNWFATDFNGLTPAWDDNMAYSFHKYWNSNNLSSIQYLLDLRNNTNRPLWLGETGENSNQWFVECVQLMKNNNIGWTWWTHKKMESISAPLSVYKLPAYEVLLNYWNGQGTRPTEAYSFNALMAQADYFRLNSCVYRKDFIDALMRQPFNTSTIKFADNNIPGTIFATDYDMGQIGYAYNDVDYQNTGGGSDYNSGWSYRNDGVDIEPCTDFSSNGFNIGWIETGEWLKYSINILQAGVYNILVNIATQNTGGKFIFSLDGSIIANTLVDVPSTGGWQNWSAVTIQNVYLPAGLHSLQFKSIIGNFNLSYFEFEFVSTNINNESNHPVSFNLEQNYPNPFNPNTTIQYSIPRLSKVKITLFNLLGEEIKTLVDEEKIPGSYKVEFNSENITSGVYFYQLKAAEFLSTKKMILLK